MLISAPGTTLDLNTLLNGNNAAGTWAETSGSGQFNAGTGVFDASVEDKFVMDMYFGNN